MSTRLHFEAIMTELERCLANIDLVGLITKDLGQPRQKSSRWSFWVCPFHPDKKTPSLGVNRKMGAGTALAVRKEEMPLPGCVPFTGCVLMKRWLF